MKRNAKRAMSMALAAALAFTPMTALAATDTKGHWAEKTITAWEDAGLLKGYSDGTVRPDNQITRAEFVTMMNKALKNEAVGTTAFTDVKEGDWFYGAVSAAVGAGYTKGYPDNTFKPNATITRAEAAVMIANAAGLKADEAAANKFTDAAAIPAWAKGSIGAAVTAGYMSGYPDGSFSANKTITRAESISSLNRVMNGGQVKAEDVVVTKDDTVIENQKIDGNLIIDKAVGDGEVYVKDTEIKGDLIVQGGGDDSIYLTNVKVGGKIIMDKAGVRVQVSGKTEASAVEVKQYGEIAEKDFTGKIGTVTVTSSVKNEKAVVVNVPADKVVVDGKVDVIVKADVDTVELTKNAEDAKLEVAKNATVDKVVANAKVSITGEGKVEKLEANADGIKVDKKLEVEKVETADGVKAPVVGTVDKPSTGGGGGGGSSSSESTSNKTKLKNEIKSATALLDGTKESADGTGVAVGEYWAQKADKEKLDAAIKDAQKVADKGNSSECKKALDTLKAAVAEFNAARKEGTAVTKEMMEKVLADVEAAKLNVTVALKADRATIDKAISAEAQKVVKEGYTVTFTATGDTATDKAGAVDVAGTFKVENKNYAAGSVTSKEEKTVSITVDAREQLAGTVKVTADGAEWNDGDKVVVGAALKAEATITGAADTSKTVYAWTDAAGQKHEGATYTVAKEDAGKTVTLTVTDEAFFGSIEKEIQVKNNDASVSKVEVNKVVVAANKDDATQYTVDVAAADFDKVTKDAVVVTATDAANATVGAVTEAKDQTTPEKKVFTVEVTAEDGTTKLTYTITANKVKNDVTATVVDTTIEGEAGKPLAEKEVTITLANGTFKGVAKDADVAAWFTGLPEGMTAKVKEEATANTATITLGGKVDAATTADVTVAVPVANITVAADTNTPADAVKVAGKITVTIEAAAPVESEAKKALGASIQKANKKKANVQVSASGNGSEYTTDQQWVTETAMNDFNKAITAAEGVYNTAVEDKDYTAAKDTLEEAITNFTPTAGTQASKQNVAAAANKEEFTFKAGEKITTGNVAVITVTGATNIDMDKVTINPAGAAKGITATKTAGDANNKINVTLNGDSPEKTDATTQDFTVIIPADAITVDDTHTAKDLTVTLKVTVEDAQAPTTPQVANGTMTPDTPIVEGTETAINVNITGTDLTKEVKVGLSTEADATVTTDKIKGATAVTLGSDTTSATATIEGTTVKTLTVGTYNLFYTVDGTTWTKLGADTIEIQAKKAAVKNAVLTGLKTTDKVVKVTLANGTFADGAAEGDFAFTGTDVAGTVSGVEFSTDKATAYLAVDVTNAGTAEQKITVKESAIEASAMDTVTATAERGTNWVTANNGAEVTDAVSSFTDKVATVTLTNGTVKADQKTQITATFDKQNSTGLALAQDADKTTDTNIVFKLTGTAQEGSGTVTVTIKEAAVQADTDYVVKGDMTATVAVSVTADQP